jgi:histidine ammonia-lyase
VVGIELLAAVQGLDFHAPLRTSPSLDPVVRSVRASVPHYSADRYLADELAWAQQAVLAGAIADQVPMLEALLAA